MTNGSRPASYRSAFERYVAALEGAKPASGSSPQPPDRTVAEVMTKDVISVREDTPFKQLVDTIGGLRVDAVPVVDEDGRVAGIVSTSDLFAKVVAAGDRKALGETAADVMTGEVVTTGPDTSVTEAARTAAKHQIRRLPVVDEDGKLIGIVTRSDLLRLFLRSDDDIRAQIIDHVLLKHGVPLSGTNVDVRDGVVTLTGPVPAHLVDAVRGVSGVVAVHGRTTE